MTDLRAPRQRVTVAKPHQIHTIIAELRHQNGHTQHQLAELAHVRPIQISDWETGSKRPNLDSIVAIAHALGYDLAFIPREDT